MRELANTLSRTEAMELLKNETAPRQTVSFYRYVRIANPVMLRDELYRDFSNLGVLGRIYLAEEGINAQISIPQPNLEKLRAFLDASPLFANVPLKLAIEEPVTSFWKLAIKVKRQIVADNLPKDTYDISNVGNHLNAEQFHAAMDSGALVVDMRNKYESDIGHFVNAVTPVSQTFGDGLQEVVKTLEDKKDQKVLLYCTGGIRCEKASAFLKHNGFTDVNQLYGGIINYKHEIAQKGLTSKFVGKNYVFDGRMAEAVTDDVIGSCYTCGKNADAYDNCANDMCHALFIQCASCKEHMLGTCSAGCKEIAALPIEEKVSLRKGKKAKFTVLSSPKRT